MWTIVGLALIVCVIAMIVSVVRLVAAERATATRRRRDDDLRSRVTSMLTSANDTGSLDTADLNLQNPDGDSALHLAYHEGRKAAISRLIALGADETLVNDEGFTPAEMADVAAVERLLKRAAACLDRGQWRDPDKARPLYQSLRQTPPHFYNPALVRFALRTTNHRNLVCLAVKVGHRESQKRLATLLEAHGTEEIATVYLNAGSRVLADAARRWAAANGYTIHTTPYGGTARWGVF
ncbi:ankyrin repeat domain-containing protein [Actinoplanes auranticolor]|uniref:ankyrin repeat domain-containing protein n=1 Tax=Actinoplanes auranticolor TaxID=47988 RepID=UPI001BB39FAB|nr:ankyrin repeat domain-containing protein [Actinoplanes auranticolor]